MADADITFSIISALATIVGGALAATLGFLYARKHDTDFSLVDKLWEKKCQGFEQFSGATERMPQLLVLMKDLTISKSRQKPPNLEFIEVIVTADMLNKFHGIPIKTCLEPFINTPGHLDNYLRTTLTAQMIQDIQTYADELIYDIQHELTTISTNIVLTTNSLDHIVEDKKLLSETRQLISDYISISNIIITTGQDTSAQIEECQKRGQEIKQRARVELDHTRRAKLQKHWWNERSLYGEIYLSPDIEEWLSNKVERGEFISKSQAVEVCILERMNK